MNQQQRDKWNRRYADNAPVSPEQAAPVLRDNRQLLPASGRALDLACGRGANALLLAQCGLDSHAWDISDTALSQLNQRAGELGLALHTLQRDVEQQPPPAESFDVIVVSRFLHRPSCAALARALRPGGLLFYQTFTVDRRGGPSNPAYLLERGELLQLFTELQPRYYREDALAGDSERGLRGEALLVAQRGC